MLLNRAQFQFECIELEQTVHTICTFKDQMQAAEDRVRVGDHLQLATK